jgi:hypothetical protein
MKRFVLAVLLADLVSGCTPSKPDTQIVDTSCSWVRPIYVSQKDDLTDNTANQILSHDTKWKKFCGDKK